MLDRIKPAITPLFAPRRPEPSYPRLPLVRESGESSVAGVYLIGEAGGTPLIKLGLNQGVDVMAFAKNQEPFDNKNSSCIHCGICIDVCPMDVLSFDISAPESLRTLR